MPTCDDCKSFFPLPDDPLKGDCVTRERDERSEYWMSRPTEALRDVEDCPRFIAKTDQKRVQDIVGLSKDMPKRGRPISEKRVNFFRQQQSS